MSYGSSIEEDNAKGLTTTSPGMNSSAFNGSSTPSGMHLCLIRVCIISCLHQQLLLPLQTTVPMIPANTLGDRLQVTSSLTMDRIPSR